jgi:hypothetical protein
LILRSVVYEKPFLGCKVREQKNKEMKDKETGKQKQDTQSKKRSIDNCLPDEKINSLLD